MKQRGAGMGARCDHVVTAQSADQHDQHDHDHPRLMRITSSHNTSLSSHLLPFYRLCHSVTITIISETLESFLFCLRPRTGIIRT